LLLHDPDAPREGGFTHWVLYNIPPDVHRLQENIPKQDTVAGVGLQARNDRGKIGYVGPCPPSGIHRYFFRLLALDAMLDIKPGAPHHEVSSATQGHRVAEAELMGTYQKKAERAA
jgi:Raf kinase inhibitor-like YbhB/YbcL family protein